MAEEKGVVPDAEPKPDAMTETPETTEQLTPQTATLLPDEPASEVEKLKAEKAEIERKVKEAQEANAALERRLKDNQEYISRTRNVEKAPEVQRPQRTMDDYLGDLDKIVDNDFENDPKQGLKKAIRKIVTDVAFDRDLERQEAQKQIATAEERAFKKMLAINPESNRVLHEVEELDKECPDMQGLSFERKIEFINLRKAGSTNRTADIRGKIDREVSMAGGVGSGGVRGRSERSAAWVNDPEVVRGAQEAGFKTKQELENWANPEMAKRMYEQRKQRTA